MANSELNDLLSSLSGKLSRNSKISFRKSASGKTTAYIQRKHRKSSLHSPAQERHRQLLSLAAKSAYSIMHDEANSDLLEKLNRDYIAYNIDHPHRMFTSLQRYIMHIEYTRLNQKNSFSIDS